MTLSMGPLPPPLLRPDVVGASGYAVRPTHVQVDLTQIAHNLQVIRAHVGPSVAVMAVLKANAYGHGIQIVARHLESVGCDTLCVAHASEASALRAAGIRARLVLLSGAQPEDAETIAQHGFEPVVCTRQTLEALSLAAARAGRKVAIHLKVDTGMGRLGVRPGSPGRAAVYQPGRLRGLVDDRAARSGAHLRARGPVGPAVPGQRDGRV